MLPLRYPRVWWAIGLLLVGGVVLGSLLPSSVIRAVTLSDKIMHAGAYCLLMLWFSGLYRRSRHWVVALSLAALGFTLDVAQTATVSRSFEFGDVSANVGGILVGLALGHFVLEGWCQRLEQRFFA